MKQMAEAYHWTPRQVSEEITIPQLVILWMIQSEQIPVTPIPGRKDRNTLLTALNRRRELAGLPSMTEEEAWPGNGG